MRNAGSASYAKKIHSLHFDFNQKGYQVLIEPEPSELAIDLDGYRPDLIARRGSEVVVIAVKGSTERLPVERFKSIAERIAAQPGWRFVLVTVDDEPIGLEPPSGPNPLLDWQELGRGLQVVERLIQEGFLPPALIYLWSIAEAALRRRAEVVHLPIERFPTDRLLKQLYSFGEVSFEEFDDLQSIFQIRNRVAHGMAAEIDPALVVRGVAIVHRLVTQWVGSRAEP